ncbi:MAG: bifunctional phosphopantothenoylcysteine decarboxylase/phosphopantothenate--cysteine ligase CoaBC [Pseudomonadota bacterium]|nr:bifunctional phosphopantothenoylcysteine decarboxylase/phosphopantothenate--cysteine ligase CoaBC [Pseudomonadota bacterium]
MGAMARIRVGVGCADGFEAQGPLVLIPAPATPQAPFPQRILLGVTGGIAAYKSAELVRRLREAGAEVQVVMTEAATEFITPLTLQALSGRAVRTHLMDPQAEAAMSHIELARWTDHILIAPASADFLARLAHGLANDLLSTVCLASEAPLSIAPAMNRVMWQHPATQANCALLSARGARFLGPAEGEQACGETGAGRMLEPTELVRALAAPRQRVDLQGLTVMVTAGPTREPLDPVRFLTNRSSGKMGYAVARAAREAGAQVILVSGPVNLAPPAGVTCVRVEQAEAMREAVMRQIDAVDLFIATAAVADYRPVVRAGEKIKKHDRVLTLDLEPTPDILAEVAARARRPFTVGFAAETERVAEYAQDKRRRKQVDLIAANQVDDQGLGFDSDDNALTVFWDGGSCALPRQPKQSLAVALLNVVVERMGRGGVG